MSERNARIPLVQATVYHGIDGREWTRFAMGGGRKVAGVPCGICGQSIKSGFTEYPRGGGLPLRHVCAKHVELVIPAKPQEIVRPK